MKELKLPRGWNADGFKLENLRRLLQNNGFDLVNGYVIAKIDENWDWVFSNPPKTTEITLEEVQVELNKRGPFIIERKEDVLIPNYEKIKEDENPERKTEIEKRSRKEIPVCKKCGAYHWPMHKCPAKKEK